MIRKQAHKLIESHEQAMKEVEEKATKKTGAAKVKAAQAKNEAKDMAATAKKKAVKKIEEIKKKQKKSEAVTAAAGKNMTTAKGTPAKTNANATAAAVNKIMAKANAAGKGIMDKANGKLEAAEKEKEDADKHMKDSKELTHKSVKKVNETDVVKRESVDNLHKVEMKMGVRADPKTVIDAVDTSDGNSTAKESQDDGGNTVEPEI